MQTAVGVFGGGGYDNGIDVPPLMAENTGNTGILWHWNFVVNVWYEMIK